MTGRNWFVGPLACVLVSSTSMGASGQSVKKSVEVGDPPPIHGFSVALVLGDMLGASTPDSLPLGAKKALTDLRDFLPYKSYRLLDTQWILCCGGTKSNLQGVSGRLRGIDEQQYAFLVDFGFSGSKLSIRFSMREDQFAKKLTTGPKPTQEALPVAVYDAMLAKQQEQELLEIILAEQRKQYNPKHPTIQELETKLDKLKREIDEKSRTMTGPGKGAVIDSTFSMDVGETVVIGTSSLKGDKALIALLTAVRRPGTQTSTIGEKR